MTPAYFRFAGIDNTGASKLILFNIPGGSQLQNMFSSGARFKMLGSVAILVGASNRSLPFHRTTFTFGYNSADVQYYDADEAGALNTQIASTEWNTYFTSDQSDWQELPPGAIGSISCIFTPPVEYVFTPGDDVYYFSTLVVEPIVSDPFKKYFPGT